MFLLLFLAAICHAGQEANEAANLVLELYGTAIETSNFKELDSFLDKNYKFYPCDKTMKPLNGEKIIETIKFLPQQTIKLSKRTLEDAGFMDDKKSIRIIVNLGCYTRTIIEASRETGRWVIYFEQQNDCKNQHYLATTYMIDYNGTAYHTGRELLGNLFKASRRTNEKLLGNAIFVPFSVFYHREGYLTPLITVRVTRETIQTKPYEYIEQVEHCEVRVVDAAIWPNRSVTFGTEGCEYYDTSSFEAVPVKNDVEVEKHLLVYQMILDPLDYDLKTLNFEKLQYMDIENEEEGEDWF